MAHVKYMGHQLPAYPLHGLRNPRLTTDVEEHLSVFADTHTRTGTAKLTEIVVYDTTDAVRHGIIDSVLESV